MFIWAPDLSEYSLVRLLSYKLGGAFMHAFIIQTTFLIYNPESHLCVDI